MEFWENFLSPFKASSMIEALDEFEVKLTFLSKDLTHPEFTKMLLSVKFPKESFNVVNLFSATCCNALRSGLKEEKAFTSKMFTMFTSHYKISIFYFSVQLIVSCGTFCSF